MQTYYSERQSSKCIALVYSFRANKRTARLVCFALFAPALSQFPINFQLLSPQRIQTSFAIQRRIVSLSPLRKQNRCYSNLVISLIDESSTKNDECTLVIVLSPTALHLIFLFQCESIGCCLLTQFCILNRWWKSPHKTSTRGSVWLSGINVLQMHGNRVVLLVKRKRC